jgi:hypothetical protein
MSNRKAAWDDFLALKTRWEELAAEYNTAFNDREDAKAKRDNAAYADADMRCKKADGSMATISSRMNRAYDRMHS